VTGNKSDTGSMGKGNPHFQVSGQRWSEIERYLESQRNLEL